MKPFGVEDASIVSEIHKICFPEDGWGEASMAGTLATTGSYGLMAGEAGFIIYSCLPPQAEIITIAVLPKFRRQGVANALLMASMSACKFLGAEQMFLEVACNNLPAISLYRKSGFMDGVIRPNYYADGADALRMAVSL